MIFNPEIEGGGCYNKAKHEIESHNQGSPLNKYFETYIERKFINSEKEYDLVRRNIYEHYNIPIDEKHLFFINSENLDRSRIHRAFAIIEDPETKERYYADGRISHNRLINLIIEKAKLKLDLEKCREALGFLDPKGFPQIKDEILRQSKRKYETRMFSDEADDNIDKMDMTWAVKFDNFE